MKLYVLFILMLPALMWHIKLISGEAIGTTEKTCMDRCLLDWKNQVSNAHEELALEPEPKQTLNQPKSSQMTPLLQEAQLAECRQTVHQFDCTLKCMFEHFQVPYRCRDKHT
ncbi:uncharacterized protein LOC111595555 [Drosophila hydei]|uniref:Uncharacterized protein LOC111595555 n=1 Tax=Drosophila hydei TaxID=7224 RepID=A0A6J1LNH8_DROHY|nr:uncharacterized protein LOC111595555 [Drosophila hydei]